jgi:predicted component of type VI protein secretion system
MTQEVGTLLMKVQLVVVQGKPEGKTIPLAIPQFKIGRGEGCQLRPNNDQVSREHSMFELGAETVSIQDLGSRNGTEVNGKKLNPREPYILKNGDLVKVGPLTFAVSIEGLPAATATAPAGPARKPVSLDDVGHEEIDSWLVSDASKEPPDRPSGVYGGDTITIESLKSKEKPAAKAPTPIPAPSAKAPAPAPKPAPEPEPEPVPDPEPETAESEIEPYNPDDDGIEDLSKKAEVEAEMPEEFIDESNPFHAKKKQDAAPAQVAKGPQKDSSDAAGDILRKLMDRRRASKSS